MTSLFKFIRQLYYHALPTGCILCGTPQRNDHLLCGFCEKDLPILPNSCPVCGRFLSVSRALICGACLKDAPPYERTFALFPYEPPITHLITALKFGEALHCATLFATLLTTKISQDWYAGDTLPERIIPMPLYRKRQQKRAFNQAVEIGKPIAKRLKIEMDVEGLVRVKNTRPQSELNAKERKNNLANAFAVRSAVDYSGQRIALLDDVVTTGSTVYSASKCLKEHGAKSVHIWCVARRG